MNQIIKTKNVKGKGRVFTEVCKFTSNKEVENRVGNPKCCNKNCPHFVKFTTNKVGNRVVHCKNV